MPLNPIQVGTVYFFVLVLSLSLHEAAHALMAFWMGDRTAQQQGRLTLNPLAHLDPMGGLMIALLAFQQIGIGWAKPVPLNPRNFANPRRDVGLVALAGPLSNIIQAAVAWLILLLIQRISFDSAMVYWLIFFFGVFFQVNLALAAFNLFPVFPLDGQKVVSALLPAGLARAYDFRCVQLGYWPLLVLVAWEWFLPVPGPIGFLMHGTSRFSHFLMSLMG